ncbi:MAG: DUF4254 domain-containing protein [Spirochaetia bacterium]|nr:DUF4254 domain-containing protein [Spirochaetia bacterium]
MNIPVNADYCEKIFFKAIEDYHIRDEVTDLIQNPFDENSNTIENLLYTKCWIDTVQWHLEDIIRAPEIDPREALLIKRKIDLSNQNRNDTVEKIDEWILKSFHHTEIELQKDARMNSESPAWILDRVSILCLKIFHMKIEVNRKGGSKVHLQTCSEKLSIMNQQMTDLSKCFDELMWDIASGNKYMKVYRQLKMYNDPELNPSLYKKSL